MEENDLHRQTQRVHWQTCCTVAGGAWAAVAVPSREARVMMNMWYLCWIFLSSRYSRVVSCSPPPSDTPFTLEEDNLQLPAQPVHSQTCLTIAACASAAEASPLRNARLMV